MYEQLRQTQRLALVASFLCCIFLASPLRGKAQTYDIIRNGRVLDPESGVDGIRNIGITGNRIAAITTSTLKGKTLVDATGLTVAPGFIDLHSRGQDEGAAAKQWTA
jgi:N-acyl-D-aspartate/D-glutamate deacylase